MSTLVLPRLQWNADTAPRGRVLLVHGLGSSAASSWRLGEAFAAAGYAATAVDLRGHGLAPRAESYRISDYAGDLAEVEPAAGGAWDLVVGHSLGGAAASLAAADDPGWAARLVLLDPAIALSDRTVRRIVASQRKAFARPTVAAVAKANPAWHPVDVETKVWALTTSSLSGVEATGEQNSPWDVSPAVAALTVPTLVLAADPRRGALFGIRESRDLVAANPRLEVRVVVGAGHSLHRERFDATAAELFGWLSR